MTIDTERLKTDAAYWDEVAPHWATAYGVAGNQRVPVWFNLKQYAHVGSQKAFQYGSGICFDLAAINLLVKKPRPTNPAAPEWDGKGLPPVGCECEVWAGYCNHWQKCKVLDAKTKEGSIAYVIMHSDGEYSELGWACKFRPIRTKEQRDRDELADLVDAHQMQQGSFCTPKNMADAIIAAGWRKER